MVLTAELAANLPARCVKVSNGSPLASAAASVSAVTASNGSQSEARTTFWVYCRNSGGRLAMAASRCSSVSSFSMNFRRVLKECALMDTFVVVSAVIGHLRAVGLCSRSYLVPKATSFVQGGREIMESSWQTFRTRLER